MRSLLQFLTRHGNLLLFILLEGVALGLAFSSNHYLASVKWSTANVVIASVNNTATSITDYFSLKQQNEILALENATLREQLQQAQNSMEYQIERDTQYIYTQYQWHYIPAKVISKTCTKYHNYLVLNKGERDSIHTGMGVICSQGVVGIVSATGHSYSLVVPVIHTQTSISSRLKKTKHLVGTQWNDLDIHHVNLTNVSGHIPLAIGDTVITSGLTDAFPQDIMVGVIDQYDNQPNRTYQDARLLLSTDFQTLSYVQVVYNKEFIQIKQDIDSLTRGMD